MDTRIGACCGAAILAAGCAATAPRTDAGDRAAAESETDCLRTSLISDWDALDQRNLIVYESGRRPFHVELAQTCFGVDFATVIAFYDRRADERICGFGMDRVIVDRTIPESCAIAAVDEHVHLDGDPVARSPKRSGGRRATRVADGDLVLGGALTVHRFRAELAALDDL